MASVLVSKIYYTVQYSDDSGVDFDSFWYYFTKVFDSDVYFDLKFEVS